MYAAIVRAATPLSTITLLKRSSHTEPCACRHPATVDPDAKQIFNYLSVTM
jgi:hypothetical protein